MITIKYGRSEFNINNFEKFVKYRNITDLKWFVKNVVGIADNKKEMKS